MKRHTYIENWHNIEDNLLKRLIKEDKVEEHCILKRHRKEDTTLSSLLMLKSYKEERHNVE